MQIFVDRDLAQETFANAPTLKRITFNMTDVPIRIETFDYGTPMGWGDYGDGDIRRRVFVDGNLVPMFSEIIVKRKRPTWLPKKITIDKWNQTLELITEEFK